MPLCACVLLSLLFERSSGVSLLQFLDENLLSVFILNVFTASLYAVVLMPALSLSMNNCFLPEVFIARDLTPFVSLNHLLARLNKSTLRPYMFGL